MTNRINKSFIKNEFRNGDLRQKYFPMLIDNGVPDYSETIHSHGLNYITTIGRQLEGIIAISECPVYAPNSPLREVRPDSVWYDLETNKPVLIAEFERYNNSVKKQKKLKRKLQNLLIGHHQLGKCLETILFVYWSYAGRNPGNIHDLISILDKGFTLPNGKFISGINSVYTDYMIYHAIATGDEDHVKLNKWINVI